MPSTTRSLRTRERLATAPPTARFLSFPVVRWCLPAENCIRWCSVKTRAPCLQQRLFRRLAERRLGTVTSGVTYPNNCHASSLTHAMDRCVSQWNMIDKWDGTQLEWADLLLQRSTAVTPVGRYRVFNDTEISQLPKNKCFCYSRWLWWYE